MPDIGIARKARLPYEHRTVTLSPLIGKSTQPHLLATYHRLVTLHYNSGTHARTCPTFVFMFL